MSSTIDHPGEPVLASQEKCIAPQAVCAVIVTHQPTVSMIDNLSQTRAQVDALVVVDNGSGFEQIGSLRAASQTLGFELISNPENLGIAEALNQGVRWAKKRSYPWIILFDQDSRIDDGFMRRMFAAWETHPARERVASIHPRYVNPDTGIEPAVFRARDGGPITSMTSGALMPSWIFDRVGFFPAEFFIDQVDTEYGYRIRKAGYLNADSREAILFHSPGHPRRINFLGFSFEPTNHNAARRYYFTRNRIVVYQKYFPVFPRWILHTIYISMRETIKCFIAETDRPRKFRSLLLGMWDGLTGRMGRRDDL